MKVYEKLISSILSGDLLPGDRLREIDLAKRLNVSRTPVREAMRRLEADGLITHKPRIGAEVRTLTQEEIVELYEMRIVLEATAAKMAAKHASNSEISILEHLNTDLLDATSDPKIASKINRKFHSCILSATRNRFLFSSYNSLSNALVLLGKTTLSSKERVQEVHKQHDKIISAIKFADGDLAEAEMRAHMETSLTHRLNSLQVYE